LLGLRDPPPIRVVQVCKLTSPHSANSLSIMIVIPKLRSEEAQERDLTMRVHLHGRARDHWTLALVSYRNENLNSPGTLVERDSCLKASQAEYRVCNVRLFFHPSLAPARSFNPCLNLKSPPSGHVSSASLTAALTTERGRIGFLMRHSSATGPLSLMASRSFSTPLSAARTPAYTFTSPRPAACCARC